MEKKNTRKTVLIIILLLAVVGLSCYIVYDKFIKTEDYKSQIEQLKEENKILKDKNTTTEQNNNENSIVGEYSFSQNDANTLTITVLIDFLDDGTYYRKETATATEITYGTYTINGNSITLKQSFRHLNSVGDGYKADETLNYQLTDNGEIIEKYNVDGAGPIERTLTKSNRNSNIKKDLMNWLINDAIEYNKSLNNQ